MAEKISGQMKGALVRTWPYPILLKPILIFSAKLLAIKIPQKIRSFNPHFFILNTLWNNYKTNKSHTYIKLQFFHEIKISEEIFFRRNY